MNFPASSKGKSKKALGGVKQITRIASLDKKKARAGWLFVLPFILGFALIYIPIIWQSISFSFSEINYIQGKNTMTYDEFVDKWLSSGAEQMRRSAEQQLTELGYLH